MKRALIVGALVATVLAGASYAQSEQTDIPVSTDSAPQPTPLNYWYGMTQIALVGTVAAEIRPTEDAAGR